MFPKLPEYEIYNQSYRNKYGSHRCAYCHALAIGFRRILFRPNEDLDEVMACFQQPLCKKHYKGASKWKS